MVDEDKNKNGEPDFDDDVFDENLEDADFDDADYGSIEDEDDASFEEEYAEEEWDEGEAPAEPVARGRKEKSLYTQDKKPFLSFNTMVILGAFLLGIAVMIFTVLDKGAEQAAGQKTMFQSMMNITNVMDGGIFGGTEDPATPAQTDVPVTETEAQPDLLSNPEDAMTPNEQAEGGLPPQPSPISPVETAETDPLTPLPGADDLAPRGPDDYGSDPADPQSAETPPTDTPPAPVSAQSILENAMANRQEKMAEIAPPVDVPVVVDAAPAPVPAPQPEPVAADPAPVAPVAAAPAVPTISEEDVQALEKQIAGLEGTVESLQGEIGNIRKNSDEENAKLQKTIADLKAELAEAKSKPAPVVVQTAEIPEPTVKPAPAKTAVKRAPAKAVSKPSTQTAATGKWELRAAQPGKAWVSRPGQRDMQGIVVGENLSGIGRVTAITYQNGRWAVVGTQGQILQ